MRVKRYKYNLARMAIGGAQNLAVAVALKQQA